MKLTEERKGQIALLYIKDLVKKEGREILSLKPNEMHRKICITAHNLGISEQEGVEFVRDLLQEAFGRVINPLEETLKKEGKVGITVMGNSD